MIYQARTQIGLFIVLAIIPIIRLIFTLTITIYDIIILFLLLVLCSIHYKFKIDSTKLIYQIFIFNLPIYRKQVTPEEIKRIKFKRVGWRKKGAIIRLEKGWSIRVIIFTPVQVFNHLEQFSLEHRIPIDKTNDYKILER